MSRAPRSRRARVAILVLAVAGLCAASLVASRWIVAGPEDLGADEVVTAPSLAAADDDAPLLSGTGGEHPARRRTVSAGGVAPEPLTSTVEGTAPERRGATVHGRVVDGAGQPIEGVAAELDRVRPIAVALGFGGGGRWDALVARTDADGRYRFERVLPSDGYRVRLRTTTAILRVRVPDVLPHSVTDLGTATLSPARTLAGRVVDLHGHGVAGARVCAGVAPDLPGRVLPDDLSRFPDADAETTSGEDGSFALTPVSPKESIVLARAPSGACGVSDPVPEESEAYEAKAIVVTVGGNASVAGIVVDSAGAAVSGALVAVARPNGGLAHTTTSGPDGRFLVREVPAGPCVVGVIAGDLPPRWKLALAPTTEVRVEVPRGGRLVGRVVHAGTGTPVEEFRIELEPIGRSRGANDPMQWIAITLANERGPRAVTTRDGRFTIGPLLSAPYIVVVHVDGCAPAGPESVPDVPEGGEADLGTILVHPARHLRGQVVDVLGAPVEDAAVFVVRQELGPLRPDDMARWADTPDSAVRTDAEGRFEAGPLPPGTYVVGVRQADAERPMALSGGVRLADRDVDGVRIALPGEGGQFTAECFVRGRRVTENALILVHEGGERRFLPLGSSGTAKARTLREGRWLVAFLGRAASFASGRGLEEDPRSPATVWADLRAVPGTEEVRVDRGVDVHVRVEPPPLVRWLANVRAEGHDAVGFLKIRPLGAPDTEALWCLVVRPPDLLGYEEPGTYVVETEIDGERYAAEVTVPDVPELTSEILLRK